ncbi:MULTISPECIES: phage holin family protein [unclassified Vibrio]|uniref:phage holin family protein n=1 Tax=Vibrio TaxID=662 RepID=UPI00126807E9|nr:MULTISPECIES: phage holin family protein [unclassified Vibrio]QFT40134.1 hypothetical protein FIU99_27460 [Vibrio sp. THAF64]QGM37957.1 hypothetical protein GGC04_27055 [Vibrio sp. THAF191d]QGN73462.1 hypothetical protein GGC03_27115 [Vibrio sp. THAF191c]
MPIILFGESFTFSVLALSALSGIGSYLQGRREARLKGGFMDLITEITLALVVGLIVAYVLESHGMERGYTCALVLVASNNGADSLAAIRQLAIKGLAKFFNSGGTSK